MASNSEFELPREFSCSKELLLKAWTKPEQLKQWWKPLGKQLVDVVNDVKEGGEIRYVFEDDLTIDGAYSNVESDKLEYSWNWHFKSGMAQMNIKEIKSRQLLGITRLQSRQK